MVVAHNTVQKLYSLLKRYLNNDEIDLFIEELVEIEGNKSFIETVKRLESYHQSKKLEQGNGDNKIR
jgi:hypothetical protein